MEIRRFITKKLIAILVSVLIVIVIIIGYANSVMKYPFSVNNKARFEVKKGDNLYTVINKLNEKSLIKNRTLLKVYVKYKKIPGEIKPGFYSIKAGESINSLIYDMKNGIFDETYVKVTIPEGFEISKIADTLDEKGIISKDKFLKACTEYKLPSYIKDDNNRKYKLEGYLFPDTYEFKKNTDGKIIIDTMLSRFDAVMMSIKKESTNKISDLDNIVTMASIIEREAEVQNERAVIASVFYNRIKENMKLQSCATVEYALGYHKDKLTYNDLKVKSNYNTYLVNGLPEGPICSPGKQSILAAINPENTNYIYFVSKNNGTHFFTNNYNEFLKVKKQTQGF
ncbi:endolytic transglycosylase MltG [Clostridium hydrogenum]|uniref:endolytic transglycosylase MltG n=1 Tax=Clostridium hydrogenum TaxID=2855764 RepID=UPI001F20DDBF|nr:endolytic transglycosylase MltG [Clostridium hydrogenum]